jgi:hypothetical protein
MKFTWGNWLNPKASFSLHGGTQTDIITIDQWNWRLRMLKGEAKFCLINITADNEKSLIKNIQSIFDNNLLNLNHNSNVSL